MDIRVLRGHHCHLRWDYPSCADYSNSSQVWCLLLGGIDILHPGDLFRLGQRLNEEPVADIESRGHCIHEYWWKLFSSLVAAHLLQNK